MPQTAVHRVSTFAPRTLGPPNPVYSNLDNLYDYLSEDLVERMYVLLEENPDADFDQMVESLMEEFDGELEDVCEIMEQESDPWVESLPPAPSPAQLYNRVLEVPVLDIGSGDCEKLSKIRFEQSLTPTDVEPVHNKHLKVRKLDARTELLDEAEGKVVTSYNVLTQLDDLKQVVQVDGVHIYPDTKYIREELKSEMVDGVLITGQFRDYVHAVLERGDPVVEGYLSQSFYAPGRKVKFKPISYGRVKPFSFPMKDLEYMPHNVKFTPKYDGILMVLDKRGGRSRLTVRNGMTTFLETDSTEDFTLLLEKLPEKGPPEAFVLLRVIQFRNYVPLHGLTSLKNFVQNVKVRIGDARVYAPGDDALNKFESDGMVFRIGEMDYRYKPELSLDTSDVTVVVAKLSDEYGIKAEVVGQQVGLAEYAIQRRGDRVVFCFKRLRRDKVSETPLETVVNYVMLTQPE